MLCYLFCYYKFLQKLFSIIIIIILIFLIIIINKTLLIDLKIYTIYIFKNMNIKIYALCTFFLCTKENSRKMTI